MQEIRNTQPATERSEVVIGLNWSVATKRRLVFVVMILFLIGVMMIVKGPFASAGVDKSTTVPMPSSPEPPTFAHDYSKFSHSSPKEHADLTGRPNCAGCHRRSGTSLEPKLPVHKDCTGCHLVQFTNPTASDNPICTICHTKEGLNSPNGPTKGFPRLRSFTAEFDHAQHLRGIELARPAAGCAACHTRALRGVAETIPARLGAHQTCYECHSPGKSASDTSACGSCHKLGRYSPTSIAARSYRLGFSHAEHGPRERLNCDSCHNVLARGLPQARQVTSISPTLHRSNARATSCMTCHNGQRAFGDTRAEFNDCKRCHKGPTFKS
jgi:c(7)-type cytochrome triheme protein